MKKAVMQTAHDCIYELFCYRLIMISQKDTLNCEIVNSYDHRKDSGKIDSFFYGRFFHAQKQSDCPGKY
jgi:hypothetical protein